MYMLYVTCNAYVHITYNLHVKKGLGREVIAMIGLYVCLDKRY